MAIKSTKENPMKDLAIIAFGIVIAIMIIKTGALTTLLSSTKEIRFFGSFLAGMFFTSVFTAAPATVILGEIAQSDSLFWVALFGGFGALLGDLIILRFMKERVVGHFDYLIKNRSKRLTSIFRLRLFRWLLSFLGALIIASPLPDEIGLAMMGISKMKTAWVIPVSFFFNFLGILAIGLVAKTVFG